MTPSDIYEIDSKLVDDLLKEEIYIINQNNEIEYMNSEMVSKYGNVIGKKCFEIIEDQKGICQWCRSNDVFKENKSIRRKLHCRNTNKTFLLTEVPIQHKSGTISKMSIKRDITHELNQINKIEESEQNYRRLFESVGCGVYRSSKEGNFIDVNTAMVDMLKYDNKEEFLKLNLSKDIYAEPEDRKKFMELIEKDGQIIEFEVEFKRRDQTRIPVLITGHVLYDENQNAKGYEGFIVDRSHRKNMEKELREAHDFLNRIIGSSPNAITAADMKGNIILWNQAAEKILGYKAKDVLHKKNITEIYQEGKAHEIMRKLRSSNYGGKGILPTFPLVYELPDNKMVEGDMSAALVYDEKGNEIASVGIFVDLEERMKIEKNLRETRDQLFQSEKLAAMGRLTSQIAHELNNPLYGIMNTLELLKTEIPKNSKRRKILEMALSETFRLTDMLKKMLSFSKPDEEKKQPVDINKVIDEIMLLHEKQLWEHSVKVRSHYEDNIKKVLASKNHLRQVYLNIISNAKDAMPDGGKLTIKTWSNKKNVYISFTDTGTGIQKEHLDEIFDSFFTTKGKVQGVGLGLSVCYGLIQDHGGKITAESKPDKETTFTVILPVHQS